jgi:hypothetical protein
MSTAHITVHATPNLAEVPQSLSGLLNTADVRMQLLGLTHSLRTASLNRESKYYDTATKYGKSRAATEEDEDDDDDEDDTAAAASTAAAAASTPAGAATTATTATGATGVNSPLQISNWAGGDDFKRLLSESDNEWLADVFMSVPECHLSRNDLFHAHLVHIPAAQDIVLLFHCKVTTRHTTHHTPTISYQYTYQYIYIYLFT